jgi:seryl-tRNA synthetase
MLDIRLIRKNPEKVKEGIKKKRFDEKLVDEILEIDRERREKIKEVEELRAEINKISKAIGKEKDEKKKKELLKESKEISEKLEELEKELEEKEKKFEDLMAKLPNLPFDDVPVGKDETQNVVLREVGERPKFDFNPKDHLEIGERLDLIDVKRAAKTREQGLGF